MRVSLHPLKVPLETLAIVEMQFACSTTVSLNAISSFEEGSNKSVNKNTYEKFT